MTMRREPPRKVVHLEDGQWFRIDNLKSHREICCRCLLAHDIEYRRVGRHLEFRATINARVTAALRRRRKRK